MLASHEFGEGEEKRPTVQIGDPFTEKCLIEACLEAVDTDAIVAMKDMGAAGVTCTTSEMAAAGSVGMRVELQRIPRRESGMQPYEVMMSESQERMLLVAERGREGALLTIAPTKAADLIYAAYRKRAEVVYVPWFWRWIMLVIRLIPERMFKRMSL